MKTQDKLGKSIMALCQGENAGDVMSTLLACIGLVMHMKSEQVDKSNKEDFFNNMREMMSDVVNIVERSSD